MRKVSQTLVLFLTLVLVAGFAALASPGGQALAAGVRVSALSLVTTKASSTTTADGATTKAVQAVIQKANQEQTDAIAQGDPTLMQDTATSDYYAQSVQNNQDLVDNGVTAIKLVAITWGPVTVQNGQAQATTNETWQTTYNDGSTDQSTDRNVYTLVQQNGSWVISADDHPDANPTGGTVPSANPAPSGSTNPSGPNPNLPGGRTDTSQNWSGYDATGGTFTGVTGTWTVPQVGAASTSGTSGFGGRGVSRNLATGATWVGVGGVQSRDLIQAGTEEISAGSNQVRYDAWIEMLPRASNTIPLAVSPGDSVTVSIDEQGQGNQWQIAFKNDTTGQTYQTTVTYASSLSSAEWVVEAPSNGRSVLPLDNFGSIQFSAASAIENGKTVNLTQSGAQPITMVDAYGDVLATPSAIASNGSGFTVTRSTSSSAAGSDPFAGSGGFPSSGFGGFPGSGYGRYPTNPSIPPWWFGGGN